jgi:hypothetical protein
MVASDDGPHVVRLAGHPVLYHVSGTALPAGHVLQQYALARDCHEPLARISQARQSGLRAVVDLIASDVWHSLPNCGPYPRPMMLLEAVFEWMRVQSAPALPSRLAAVFAWETLALANRYRAAYRPGGVIHRGQLVSGRSATHDAALIVGAFEAADLITPTMRDVQLVEERAARYWRGLAPMALPEVLVHGDLVVESVIDPGEANPKSGR